MCVLWSINSPWFDCNIVEAEFVVREFLYHWRQGTDIVPLVVYRPIVDITTFHCRHLSGHHRGSPMFCPYSRTGSRPCWLATGQVDWLLVRLTGCWPGWLAAVQVDRQMTRLTGSWVQGDWLPSRLTGRWWGWLAAGSRLTGCRPGWLAGDQVDWQLGPGWLAAVQVDWLRAACGGLEDSCTDHALIVIHTNALKASWK